ncbi:MAG: hypothetical protein LBQ93_06900 [Treponema sp.]|jgi:hypothetical protein|nr:hypothetical protein [Treponema sp.]
MGLKTMINSEVRSRVGSRGFMVKQTDVGTLICHGGIDEIDIALKHGIQSPMGINLIFCKNGIEIKAIASGKVILSAIPSSDIVSIKFAGGIQPSGNMAGVATGTLVGGFLLGPIGALAGAAAGLNVASSGRICYAIEYKAKPENGTLLVSFFPGFKKKVDKLFSKAYPALFDPTMS